jgi:hypothetical protein
MTGERLLPEEAAQTPELLVMAALDTTLWTLQIALIAAFPELIDDDYNQKRDGPRARKARLLSDRATGLAKAIARYRKALRAERAPPPDPTDCYF